jgi:AAHS family 4-hydroxybenzoate transporter-like MFS transporter
MTQGAQAPLDVLAFVDARPLGRFQLRVVVLCALVMLLDGFDAQAIGYVAPAIVKAWHVNRAALSPVFAAGLIGLMLGALACGPIADRFGRRPVLLTCVLSFGVAALLTTAAGSLRALAALRFVTGLGLGGAMPNAIALTREYGPRRIRATLVMVMFCGFTVGAALGGVAAASVAARLGWKAVFAVGGVAPLALLAVLVPLLPESIRYLVVRGDRRAEVAAILSRIDGARRVEPSRAFAVGEERARGFAVKELFADRRAAFTLLLWLVFFMSLLDLYLLTSWLPTIVHDAGVPQARAVLLTAAFQVGGTAGTLLLGRLFDRFAPFVVLAATYVGASAFVLLIGAVGVSLRLLFLTIFGAGFCVVGGQCAANALAAESYPTSIRSTGVGWALGVGRIGSIVGPLVGGVLLSLDWPARSIFLFAAAPVLVAALAAFALAALRSSRGAPLSPRPAGAAT